MTIVRLGSPILQVPREKNRRKYLEQLWVQIEDLIVYMVERCTSSGAAPRSGLASECITHYQLTRTRIPLRPQTVATECLIPFSPGLASNQ